MGFDTSDRYRRSVESRSKLYYSYPTDSPLVTMDSPIPRLSVTRSKSVPFRYSSPQPVPVSPPKFVMYQRHYPLPPPSFPDAMIAVSKRLRNRSKSPCPQYSDLGVSSRPRIQSAALGHYAPTKYLIKSNLGCNIAPDYQNYSHLPPLPYSSSRQPLKY
ncbi:uncharacterized protein [Lepeophtheirus salmonis]|uniref:uncharacterized protein isoform X1 n=1 Tax=Lepeophtheirus salmonis TaxID=72036 RepID=UPI001AE28805|nr:uncharacterized protein LOC121120328 isoform X1 [Lepeophtheirus salmonis]